MKRREFLTAGVAATATWAAGCGRLPAMEGTLVRPGMEAGHRLRDGAKASVDRYEAVDAIIVGGGIAGLAAARALMRRPGRKVVLIELCDEVGGNSAWGGSGATSCPWGAHYVPIPGRDAGEVNELFEALGIIEGRDAQGVPRYREDYLCHDPEERLFLHGRWQDGLIPHLGLSAAERDEIGVFLARMEQLRHQRGADGRAVFAIPVDASSTDATWRRLDSMTFAQWLDGEGFRGAPLRWYLDYACRDDFGLPASRVSAWAGIHYFASRAGVASNAPAQAVVTWPEGNGWLARRLLEPVAPVVRRHVAAMSVQDEGDGVRVDAWDMAAGRAVGWIAKQAVLAVPQFVCARLLGAAGQGRGTGAVYAPWLVANLTITREPSGRGAPLSWDNVILAGKGLGYVSASHQRLGMTVGERVLTYYLPLDHRDVAEARREAAGWEWAEIRDRVLEDLSRAHPDLATMTRRLDARVWGHGMIAPVPGYLWGGERERWGRATGRIRFAHTDLSGISIFEEAYTRGVRAGKAAGEAFES